MSKRSIQYIQQDDPSFLKKFKQRVGFQEGPNVDTKKAELPVEESDSDNEKEDEKPQIVVLKKGHLSQEEVDQMKKECSDSVIKDEDEIPSEGKILFKKPVKKHEDSTLKVTTKKDKLKLKEEKMKNKNDKKIKNKTLLSFDDEEDEDG